MTWFNVTRGVMNELFPVLSITMQKCIEDKLAEEPNFKLNDMESKAVKDIIERLKAKRAMNNKEISHLEALIQRANDHQQSPPGLVHILHSQWHYFHHKMLLGRNLAINNSGKC